MKLSADKLLVFISSQAQVLYFFKFMKYAVFISWWPRTIKNLISNLPWTRKFSKLIKNTGGKDLFLPRSRVGHALRPTFMLWLVKIWQVSSCGKLCSILKLVYFDSWSWQSFVSTCDVFNCLFPLNVQNEIQLLSSLLFMASLFIGFLVERCVTCQSWKSDFGWHRFQFSPCLMRIEEDSKFSSDSHVTW